jgi:galactokinase
MRQPTFQELFETEPAVRAASPGRVNLIGDHTDYNGGFVLPTAIPQQTRVELARHGGRLVKAWSASFAESGVVQYQIGEESADHTWTDYVKGMTFVLRETGVDEGFSLRIESDVPAGGGLGSSAALEIAVGRALREAFGLSIDDIELAIAARRAENDFVGAPVGIMDQMACSLAAVNTALLIDTRSLRYDRVPLPGNAALIVIDSGLSHRHQGGGYVERRRECEQAAMMLGVRDLRDVPEPLPDDVKLPARLARRVRHVVSENCRVLETVSALRSGDLERAGDLFVASHRSLRDDFEVSVPDVDRLVEIAMGVRGVFGARMTGGGFGGAVVALARKEDAGPAAAQIASEYVATTGNRGKVIVPT